ncbi:MAG: hypothetical protein HZB14_05090, partial [Actinobacteria bacterium]|nr:hypothetical protein [Actinomycetota bacterium]
MPRELGVFASVHETRDTFAKDRDAANRASFEISTLDAPSGQATAMLTLRLFVNRALPLTDTSPAAGDGSLGCAGSATGSVVSGVTGSGKLQSRRLDDCSELTP